MTHEAILPLFSREKDPFWPGLNPLSLGTHLTVFGVGHTQPPTPLYPCNYSLFPYFVANNKCVYKDSLRVPDLLSVVSLKM